MHEQLQASLRVFVAALEEARSAHFGDANLQTNSANCCCFGAATESGFSAKKARKERESDLNLHSESNSIQLEKMQNKSTRN